MSQTTTTRVRTRGGIRREDSIPPDYRVGGKGDLYDRNTFAKWMVNLFIALYIVAFGLYGVIFINFNEIYSFFTIPGDPCGELVSTRYNNITYWAIAFSVFRIFFIIGLLGIIGFKRVVGCTTAWVVVMFLVIAADFFVWVTLFFNVVTANTPLRPTICDDLLKCNAPEFYNNPVPNRCLNTALTPRDIDLTRDELIRNSDCLWLFWSNSAWLFVLDPVLMGFTMIIWVGVTNWEQLERVVVDTRKRVESTVRRVRRYGGGGGTSEDNDPLSTRPGRVRPLGPTTASSGGNGGERKRPVVKHLRPVATGTFNGPESSKDK